MPRRERQHVDLAAIKIDLEFLIERLSKLPTRKELALRPSTLSPGAPGW